MATSCRTCCRSTRRCTGRTRRKAPTRRTALVRATLVRRSPRRLALTPVPCRPCTHVHGAVGVGDESDGYAEAWFLPAASNIPAGYATEGHLVRLLRGQGRRQQRVAGLGTRLRHLRLPQREPGLDHLVPRPRAGHDASQRVRRPGRVLHRSRRPQRRQGGARLALRHGGRASRSGAERRRQVPAQQEVSRDPDRHPGSRLQRGWLAVLSRLKSLLRRRRPGLHPGRRLLADLEPGVLRQHDHGQRQHLAVPERGAGSLPLPLLERLSVALPHPGLQQHPRCRGVADRQRGRLPGRAGEPSRRTAATDC